MHIQSFSFGIPDSYLSYKVETNEKGLIVRQIDEYPTEDEDFTTTLLSLSDFERGCLCCAKEGNNLVLYAYATTVPFHRFSYLPESDVKDKVLNNYVSFTTDWNREFRVYRIPEYNSRTKKYYVKGAYLTCVDTDGEEYLFIDMAPEATEKACNLKYTLRGHRFELSDIFPEF